MSPDKKTLDALRIDRRAAPQGRTPVTLIATLLIAIALAAGSFFWFNDSRPVVVQTIVVRETEIGGDKTLLNASGYVTARRQATVSSKVTGKVVEVLFEEGMKVETGQLLARLDASGVEKSLHLAEAKCESARKALDETRATLARAERDLRRTSALAAANVQTESELDRAQTEAKMLYARLERQQADVVVAERETALWKQQLEDTLICAPFSGIVTSKDAQPGEMISPMSVGGFTRTGICTIVDMNSLEIEVDVSESYINRVAPDQRVEATLDSYPNWRIPAKVITIIPTADRQKATVKVRVGFEKVDPRILPEMSAKVAFQSVGEATSTLRSITLPKEAVHRRDGRDIVWVVREGSVEQRAVTVGAASEDEVTIAAGISGGERVVAKGPAELAEGARVREAKQ